MKRIVLLTVAALAVLGTAVGAWTGRHLIALWVRGEVVQTSTEAGEERLDVWMKKLDGLGEVDAAELGISDRSVSLLLQTRTNRDREPRLPDSRRLEAMRRQTGVTITFQRLSDGRHHVRMARGEPDGNLETFDLSPTLAGMRLKWLAFERVGVTEEHPPALVLEGFVDQARTSVAAPRLSQDMTSHGTTVMALGRAGAAALTIWSFTPDEETILKLTQAFAGERRQSSEEGR